MDRRGPFEFGRRARLISAGTLVIWAFTPIASGQALISGRPLSAPAGAWQLSVDALAMEAIDVGPAVKDAPFSAEAMTTIVQTLSDGNRITRRTAAAIYRDSRGRTRREVTLDNIAGIMTAGAPLRVVTISDPGTGLTYVIEADQQLRVLRNARDLPRPVPVRPDAGIGRGAGVAPAPPPGTTREEALGARTIAGIDCQGTRTTLTVPAGAIGNERPIESVTERWFSPALEIVVLSRRSDPRYGVTTYALTRITRTEPPAALFEPPPR